MTITHLLDDMVCVCGGGGRELASLNLSVDRDAEPVGPRRAAQLYYQ